MKTETPQTENVPAVVQPPLVQQSSVDHAQILRTWEDSLKDMQSRIRVEQKKAEEATIKVNALQEEYWRLEGRLDVAKELVRKQSLLNAQEKPTP